LDYPWIFDKKNNYINMKNKYASLSIALLACLMFFACESPVSDNPEPTPSSDNFEYKMEAPLRAGLQVPEETELEVYLQDNRPKDGARRLFDVRNQLLDIRYTKTENGIYLYGDVLLIRNHTLPKGIMRDVKEYPEAIKLRFEGELREGVIKRLNGTPISRSYASLLMTRLQNNNGSLEKIGKSILRKGEYVASLYLSDMDLDNENYKLLLLINRTLPNGDRPFQLQVELELEGSNDD